MISSLGRAKCKSLGTVRDNFRSRGSSSFRKNGTKEKEVRPRSCVKSHIVHLATTLLCDTSSFAFVMRLFFGRALYMYMSIFSSGFSFTSQTDSTLDCYLDLVQGSLLTDTCHHDHDHYDIDIARTAFFSQSQQL